MMTTALSLLQSTSAWVWVASWQATVIAALVMITQWIFRRHLAARWRNALWLLVFARLLMPVLPQARFSAYNWLPEKAPVALAALKVTEEIPPPPVATELPEIANMDHQQPLAATPNRNADRGHQWRSIPALPIAWGTGFLVVLGSGAVGYVRLRRRVIHFQQNVPASLKEQFDAAKAELRVHRVDLVVSEAVTTPMVTGLWRARIVLPVGLESALPPEDVRMVLLHELAHVKRGDLWLAWLAWIAGALHWFNPAVRYFIGRARKDREMACDEWVLQFVSNSHAYGSALVRFLESRQTPTQQLGTIGIFESKSALVQRVKRIAAYRRPTVWGSAIGAVLLVTVGAFTLTGASDSKPTPQGPSVSAQEDPMRAIAENDASKATKAVRDGAGANYNQEIQDVPTLKAKAEAGDAQAQYELGLTYFSGKGVPKDEKEGVQWYRKAAEQGHVRAQTNLGACHARGEGVPKDEKVAVEWYRKAAEQGYAQAQYTLGLYYAMGMGVPKDEKLAELWLRKAAEKGYAWAQYNLGLYYARGTGMPKDEKEAVQWYRKAAEQGLAQAQLELGGCYARGVGVPKDEKVAIQWCRKAAEQGFARAQSNLGDSYLRGFGVPKDEKEGVQWLRKAAEQGYAGAQFALWNCYRYGLGVNVVPQDETEAVKWLRKAAEQGYAWAQLELGNCYASGVGVNVVPKDETEAVKWFRKAAEQGLNPAKKALERLEVEKSFEEFEKTKRSEKGAALETYETGGADDRLKAFQGKFDLKMEQDKKRYTPEREKGAILESTEKWIVDARRKVFRGKFNLKMAQDKEKYTPEQLNDAEKLYQVANKNWGATEARESLQKMIQKYPDINRTGCAILYVAQQSSGEEQIKFLKLCIEKYNDCYYGDGVQVGVYARFYLAWAYQNQGAKAKAEALYKEIKTHYADAINHEGKLLVDSIP